MFYKSFLTLGLIIFTISIFGCDESCDPCSATDENHLFYQDFVHFDTDSHILVFNIDTSVYSFEPAVDGDRSLGEHFCDCNGNGTYEEEIDIFIMSNDEFNQDCDRNSRYTGPHEVWTPCIPFDDLDGDGEYDVPNMTNPYEPGRPFCDYNENGIADDSLEGRYSLTKIMGFDIEPEGVGYEFLTGLENYYEFHSDSDQLYHLPPYMPLDLFNCDFLKTDREFIFVGPNYMVPITDSGNIMENSDFQIKIRGKFGDSALFFGTIEFLTDYSLGLETYDSLLSISYCLNESGEKSCLTAGYEFYFDRRQGLVAVNLTHEPNGFYILNQRYYHIPLPMTRIPPSPEQLATK
jgi:hypothetical protein